MTLTRLGLFVGFSCEVGFDISASVVDSSVPVTLPEPSLSVVVVLSMGAFQTEGREGMPIGIGCSLAINSGVKRGSFNKGDLVDQSLSRDTTMKPAVE